MASKYENQNKVICGLEFTSHEYKNKKIRVTTEFNGETYEYHMGTQTWRNAKDSKHSCFNPNGWRFKKYFKKIIKCLIIWKPIVKDFLGRTLEVSEDYMFNELEYTDTDKDVHKWYKKYAKFYHPDSLGRKLFPEEEVMFEIITDARDAAIEQNRIFSKYM